MKHVRGNLLDTEIMLIAHGCNCQGGFGSGVAGAIATRWPEVKQEYHRWVDLMGKGPHLLGTYAYALTDDKSHIIANCFTQNNYGSDGEKYASYTAIVQAFTQLISEYKNTGAGQLFPNEDGHTLRIAIPEIGCGLGGLKWPIVAELLCELEERFDAEFTVYRI